MIQSIISTLPYLKAALVLTFSSILYLQGNKRIEHQKGGSDSPAMEATIKVIDEAICSRTAWGAVPA